MVIKLKVNRSKRDKEINVRVSHDEKEKIRKNAKGNMANFMRALALGHEAPEPRNVTIINRNVGNYEVADPQLLTQIAALGNLLNQALKLANREAKMGYSLNVVRLMAVIESTKVSLEKLKKC